MSEQECFSRVTTTERKNRKTVYVYGQRNPRQCPPLVRGNVLDTIYGRTRSRRKAPIRGYPKKAVGLHALTIYDDSGEIDRHSAAKASLLHPNNDYSLPFFQRSSLPLAQKHTHWFLPSLRLLGCGHWLFPLIHLSRRQHIFSISQSHEACSFINTIGTSKLAVHCRWMPTRKPWLWICRRLPCVWCLAGLCWKDLRVFLLMVGRVLPV